MEALNPANPRPEFRAKIGRIARRKWSQGDLGKVRLTPFETWVLAAPLFPVSRSIADLILGGGERLGLDLIYNARTVTPLGSGPVQQSIADGDAFFWIESIRSSGEAVEDSFHPFVRRLR